MTRLSVMTLPSSSITGRNPPGTRLVNHVGLSP